MDKKLPLLTAAVLFLGLVQAQDLPKKIELPPVGIKTNLLYDATTTFNLGIEFRTGNKSSFDISGNWNPWTFSNNRKWKHALIQPEFRLWTKETFSGHFFGLHAHYASYNVGNLPAWLFSQNMKDSRYEGWLAGAGVGYGYRWNFNRHWGLETEIGIGYAYLDYTKYECNKCGEKLGSGTRNYFGPTKAAISLVYNFGKRRTVAEPAPVYVYVPQVVKKEIIAPAAPLYAISYITPEAEAVKKRSEEGKAYLDFAVGKSEIVSSLGNNARELQKIHDLITEVKNDPDATITGITIAGYASPEGTYQSNMILSEKRASALKNHIKTMYGFPENFFIASGKGEDWSTLDTLVAQSFVNEKYSVLEIIRTTDLFDGREKKLMNLAGGNTYRQLLKEMFPQLRRSEYSLRYTVAPFTVEKGKEVFQTKPSSLSLIEMFLIAKTYEPGSDAFNEVFETAARMFPHDDTANLNAAAAALERSDAVSAGHYLSKVSKPNADYYNSSGILHSLQGEYRKAATEFGRATNLGSEQSAGNSELLIRYQEALDVYQREKRESEPSATQ